MVIVLSFLNYNLASPASWAGIQNYINMFKFDGAAHSLGVTVYYVLLNIPAQTILALGLAVMIDRKRSGRGCTGSCSSLPTCPPRWPWGSSGTGCSTRNWAQSTISLALFGIQGPAWLCQTAPGHADRGRRSISGSSWVSICFLPGRTAGDTAEPLRGGRAGRGQQVAPVLEDKHAIAQRDLLFVLITDVIGSFQVFDTLYVLTRAARVTQRR